MKLIILSLIFIIAGISLIYAWVGAEIREEEKAAKKQIERKIKLATIAAAIEAKEQKERER